MDTPFLPVLPVVVAGLLLAAVSAGLAVAVRIRERDLAGVRQPASDPPQVWIKTVADVVALSALLFVVTQGVEALVVKPFSVTNNSMVPTLLVGEQVLVDRFTPRFDAPDRGDIVVFYPPAGAPDGACGVQRVVAQACPRPTRERSNTLFIKRVVAVPGDRLSVLNGLVSIDGQVQAAPHIGTEGVACAMCDLPMEVTVPPDHYFMMGDNRAGSDDSRLWGPVPRAWIVGRTFFSYWPPSRFGRS